MKSQLIDANSIIRDQGLRMITPNSKRLRPSLMLAVYDTLGGKIDQNTINAGASLEMVHLGSLIHDDIIDRANLRWNKPTLYNSIGADQAIIIGDYFLAKANQLAASINKEIAICIANTISRLCDGQSQELLDINNLNRTKSDYIRSIGNKTSSLLSAACETGFLLTNKTSTTDAMPFRNFGEYFGLSFQLIDDLLDFISNNELSGKNIGNDFKSGIYTYPIILALSSKNRDKYVPYVIKPKSSLNFINKLLLNDGYFDKTLNYILKTCKQTENFLSKVDNKINIYGLRNLQMDYLTWSIEHQTIEPYRSKLINQLLDSNL